MTSMETAINHPRATIRPRSLARAHAFVDVWAWVKTEQSSADAPDSSKQRLTPSVEMGRAAANMFSDLFDRYRELAPTAVAAERMVDIRLIRKKLEASFLELLLAGQVPAILGDAVSPEPTRPSISPDRLTATDRHFPLVSPSSVQIGPDNQLDLRTQNDDHLPSDGLSSSTAGLPSTTSITPADGSIDSPAEGTTTLDDTPTATVSADPDVPMIEQTDEGDQVRETRSKSASCVVRGVLMGGSFSLCRRVRVRPSPTRRSTRRATWSWTRRSHRS